MVEARCSCNLRLDYSRSGRSLPHSVVAAVAIVPAGRTVADRIAAGRIAVGHTAVAADHTVEAARGRHS